MTWMPEKARAWSESLGASVVCGGQPGMAVPLAISAECEALRSRREFAGIEETSSGVPSRPARRPLS